MRVTVRLFALQRELTGRRCHELRLPEGATVGEAWAALTAELPQLAPSSSSVRFARNARYADPGEPLTDGDELAVIPPVAGGSGEGPRAADPARYRRIGLQAGPLEAGLVEELRGAVATPADGAVVIFIGQTRETPGTPAPGQEAEAARHTDERVTGLSYEAFEPMAVSVLEVIADEVEQRFGVRRVAIIHRTGDVALGEASVVIVVAAPHREPAFDACRYVIEELKARAPIWKSERFVDGSVWLGTPARSGPPETGP
jgi:molybdopterin synthase catalytic subunit